MAGCMDEFDEATPLRGTYCSRLTSDEYEEQGARWDQQFCTDLYSSEGLLDTPTTRPLAWKSIGTALAWSVFGPNPSRDHNPPPQPFDEDPLVRIRSHTGWWCARNDECG